MTMAQFWFRGDLCQYTGNSTTVQWADEPLYEFKYVEGHRAGEVGHTFNPPPTQEETDGDE